ncbi:MAG: sigma 54-interacting transcriptional regulator [Desulfobulbaceae bacterium]|nr:sigma 54-interacting transcriptional regulator [Desulfobulbaceae bacterium]
MQDIQLTSTQQEVSRLSHNSKMLFDLFPDMLLIIKDDFVIEQMNTAAKAKLGEVQGRKCYQVIMGLANPCETSLCPFSCMIGDKQCGKVLERKLHDNFYVEYTYVPFEGYRQDKLILVVLRDITQKKLHELELEKYSTDIEKILREKISVLTATEQERQQLSTEINYLKKETERLGDRDKMIGESNHVRVLRETIYQVAESNATILITGESGTGKELIADLIYKHSSKKKRRYLKFNCAAVSESLLESELFGYEKGAFTGASSVKKGKFEEADGGTIFLDEIGDISPKMQSSLLRVLQNGEILRVGSNHPIAINVRIIAATNINLAEAVKKGQYREDLYYRLNVINLHQVPLRERKEDIILLATNFLIKYRERFNKEVSFLPNSVVEKLLAYDWPGNVRELENVIQRAVLLSRNGMITPKSLDITLKKPTPLLDSDNPTSPMDKFLNLPLKKSISLFEAELISTTLKKCSGKTDNVSEQLGVAKTTLYEKMKRYGITSKIWMDR